MTLSVAVDVLLVL